MSLLDRTVEYSIKKGYIDAAEGERVKAVVKSISGKHKFPEEWLVKMVLVEAEGFNARRDSGRCVGVVQVCRNESTVDINGGIREVGGYEAFKAAGPAKQLELWEKYHLAYWVKAAGGKTPQTQGDLMVVNIWPRRYIEVINNKVSRDAPVPSSQASFLYVNYDPKTGNRGSYWSVNSASKGMDIKVEQVLGSSALDNIVQSTISSIKPLADLTQNTASVISNGLATLNSGIQSALLKGSNCPPPLYTQQDRIIYPGCLQKTNSPTYGNALGSGASAPAINSLSSGQQPGQLNNTQPYTGELKPGAFIVPMKKGTYTFTSGFGMRWGRPHQGIDLAAPIGTPIYAAADGIVTDAAMSGIGGFGSWIRIQHPNNIRTLYGHVSKIYVTVNQQVKQGDRIADVGNEGRSTGSHLHLEIQPGGNPVDPLNYIKV